MGMKRPSHKADPKLLAQAEAMRRAGATYSEIEAAVGITRGALCQHFKSIGLAGGGADKPAQVADEASAEDALEADRSRRLLRKTRRAIEAAADLIYRKARPGVGADGKPVEGVVDAKELAALTAAMRESGKLERLYRGSPTSVSSKTVTGKVEHAHEHTQAEKRAIEGLRIWKSARTGGGA